MSETLYATFADPNRARKAADELLKQGVNAQEISLLVNDHERVKHDNEGVDLENTRTTVPLAGTSFLQSDDPLGNTLRQSSVSRIESGVNVELNPAQSDYPGKPVVTTAFSSAPPNAGRDYNEGLDDKDYNRDYKANVSDDIATDKSHDEIRREESLEATPYDDQPGTSKRYSRGFNAIGEDSPETIKVDPDADAYRDADPHVKEGATASDVGHGAAQGAGIGLGFGALAALATILIPGIGLVVGAGTLAVAAGAMAAGVGVGAVAGGITGLLKEQGVPESKIATYSSTYEKGGAILAVTVVDQAKRVAIEQLLTANGAQDIETHQAYLS